MQLSAEEGAAGGHHAAQLKQTGGAEQRLDCVLAEFDVARVAVVDQRLQRVPRDLAQRHLLVAGLLQRPREHGTEVGTARRQHQAMRRHSRTKEGYCL